MNTTPCIKNKCILLPICKSKIEIQCDKIAEYMFPVICNKCSVKKYVLVKRKIFKILTHTIRITGYHKEEFFTFYSDRGII